MSYSVRKNDERIYLFRRKRKRRLIGVSVVIASGALLYFGSSSITNSKVKERNISLLSTGKIGADWLTVGSLSLDPSLRASDEELDFDINSAGYPKLTSNSPDISGYKWRHIAEPYRTAQFTSVVSTAESSDSFEWLLLNPSGEEVSLVGESFEHDFASASTDDGTIVVLRQVNEQGDVVRWMKDSVRLKYVRREIRSLTDTDLKDLITSMRVIWDVKTEDGWDIYGTEYKGIDYFNMKHMTYAADPMCNHLHEGPGLYTQHMALTLEFEKSLQSVAPALAVPYWDFTIDATLYGKDWSWKSEVLADDVFGPALSPSYSVDRGTWAFTPLGDFGSYTNRTPVHNSYGLMRAPWNNSPYPFLTRWHSIATDDGEDAMPSSCSDYHEALQDETWSDLAYDLGAKAHGNLHPLIGGSWWEYKEDWYDQGLVFPVGSSTLYLKYFWRAGLIRCPVYCSPLTPREDCPCGCDFSSLESESGTDDGSDLFTLAMSKVEQAMSDTPFATMISNLYKRASAPEGFEGTDDDYVEWLIMEGVCDAPSIGDNFDAESTHDPTFWPMHPTIDRLVHYMRLAPDPFKFNWDAKTFTCPGHNYEDVVPFSGLFEGDDAEQWYTNKDLYLRLDPGASYLPYVYDSFSWPHCEDVGYNMSNVRE